MVPRALEPTFDILVDECPAAVTEHELAQRRVFQIEFDDQRKPLYITVAEDRAGTKFWTSVPEGRQEEAEKIGKLVATYIRSKKPKK